PEKGLIGLVGASGAGKSALINVLAGRTEVTQGKININQTEVKTIHDEAWFENIAYIPQHTYIFTAYIYDNIRFYDATTSGAGKSAVINVLAGRTEVTQGKININQTEVKTLHDEAWFENIAYIPQHPYIFPASIYDNIRFYEPNASRAAVQKVIEQIGLTD